MFMMSLRSSTSLEGSEGSDGKDSSVEVDFGYRELDVEDCWVTPESRG